MEMQPVTSSNIHAIGHDEANKRLTIQFKGDPMRTYHHEGVSGETFDALLGEGVESHSVGKHYAKFIKGKFPHKLVEDGN